MGKCRFITLGDGQVYTTANELGHYLETRGLRFYTDDNDSRHFGSSFNVILGSKLKQNAQYWESYPYTLDDYPKLVVKDDNGVDVNKNKRIVDILIKNFMCDNASVALINKGSKSRGLDLYTIRAVRAIIAYFGSAHNINLVEEDIEFLCYCDDVPQLQRTTRIDTVAKNPQRKLITV